MQLLEADDDLNAMLLERCEPGTVLRSDPDGTIRHFSDLLGVDHERVRLWTFARAAAESRDDWEDYDSMALARALAP